MMNIKARTDINQPLREGTPAIFVGMILSKSFGYALQGVLYVASASNNNGKIQLDKIAETLTVPRYFLGKVMKRLAKEGVLNSVKGHHGGFSINEKTLHTSLLKLAELTGEMEQFDSCVLKSRICNTENPCPLHHKFEPLKKKWQTLLASTTIGDLLRKEQPDFIRSIAAI